MKNKLLKRIITLALAVILIVSACPVFSSAASNSKAVASVSVFCVVKTPGHSWIYVENLSKKTIKVGAYTLKAGEGVSIGTFGPTRYDGHGIYYNVESYCQTKYGMSNYSTLTEYLDADGLNTLHNSIVNYKNDWSFFRNCVTFAAKVWNSVSNKKLSNLIIPAFTNLQMTLKGCQKNGIVQKPVTADQVYRQKGTGEDAYLVNVRNASLGNLW